MPHKYQKICEIRNTQVFPFIGQIADAACGRRPRDDENGDADARRGAHIGGLMRRWGMTSARAGARLLLQRLAFVGRGGVAAARRRECAFSLHASRRGEAHRRGQKVPPLPAASLVLEKRLLRVLFLEGRKDGHHRWRWQGDWGEEAAGSAEGSAAPGGDEVQVPPSRVGDPPG